jgi:uncharacterized membrane protein
MDADERLANIERRLQRIESRLALPPLAPPDGAAPATPSAQPPAARPAQGAPAAQPAAPRVFTSYKREPDQAGQSSIVTTVLGWGGALALVLAASYLIRLAYDAGWLTPVRQISFAAVAGVALIAAGFALKRLNRDYAGLLPAGGIAILFLCIYGAHLYYGFISVEAAAAAVMLVCVTSLWLCRAFNSDLYALFAVAGSYSAPILLSSFIASLTDLVVYFSAWSVVFSVFAIWQGRRMIYLLALYLALIVFDIEWAKTPASEWIAALVFQTVQFLIFGIATIMFSIRRSEPLSTNAAAAHLPPLLLFYFLQYALLHRHVPDLAPWIAVASATVVGGLYAIARTRIGRALPGGEFLLWTYITLVLFHAGYIDSVPAQWGPWVAFVAMPIVAGVSLWRSRELNVSWLPWFAAGLVFLANYLRIVFDLDLSSVPQHKALAVVYALQLYAGYWLTRGRVAFGAMPPVLLYAGHIAAMAAALHLVDEHIVESTVWGLLALACLGLSLWQTDRVVGRSSLLMFGAAAGKVLLYDLSGAGPLVRIVSLVVLGVTFYVGGLLYQRMLGEATPGQSPART